MSSGERSIGAAKGKQSDSEALCQTPPGPSPPPLPSHLKKPFFGAEGADVLCVPQGHVQDENELFTLNNMSL